MAEYGRMAKAKRMAANKPKTKTKSRLQRLREAQMERRKARARKRVESVQKKSAAAKSASPATKQKRGFNIVANKPKSKSSKFGVGSAKTIMHNGRRLANVSADQLKKTGMSLRQYMNMWNKTGKRPTALTSKQKMQMSNFEAGMKQATAPKKSVGSRRKS